MAQSQGGRPLPNISYSYGGILGTSQPNQFGTPAQRRQYGWGEPGMTAGGQDLVREFQTQFQPNQGIFSPSFPLVPVESELARLWDFPVGYNYIWTPRAYEPVSFQELRAVAYNESITRLAIETSKDQSRHKPAKVQHFSQKIGHSPRLAPFGEVRRNPHLSSHDRAQNVD